MRFRSGFGRSFFAPVEPMKPITTGAERVTRRIGQTFMGLLLFQCLAAMAEPRPAPYEAGADHYTAARQALQDTLWPQALSALQQLAHEMPQITDDAEFHNLMGYTLRQLSPARLGAAIDHYQQALRIDPAHVQAREYLGQAYLKQDREDLAREQLQIIERLCGGQDCKEWRDLSQAIQTRLGQR